MFQRYAVYVTPQGALASIGAAWLGWDIAQSRAVAHPSLPGLDVAALSDAPRKYGMHGTIKPPFHLAQGTTFDALSADLATLCKTLRPVALEGLEVRALRHFIALCPLGDQSALAALAAKLVTGLDPHRRPPDESELARRRATPLTQAQEANLAKWGYPYVMEEFRFHITLTGPTAPAPILPAITAHFAPHLPQPFIVGSLTLAGQDEAGMFHKIRRFPLEG